MNGHEMHTRGLIDARAAILAALIGDGWDQTEAEDMLVNYVAEAKYVEPARNWQRWTDAELAVIDEALDASGNRIPGVAVTRPIAERLGRRHKAVLGAIDRRIVARKAAQS